MYFNKTTLTVSFAFLFTFLSLITSYAEEPNNSTHISTSENYSINKEDILFDSIMTIVSGNTLSFEEKYQLINYQFDRINIDSRIKLMKKLVQLAKKERKEIEAITLYSNILLLYANKDNFDQAQLYLDSALFISPNANDLTQAKLHYAAGHLYLRMANLPLAHEHLYKSISHFQKEGGYDEMIISILSNIGFGYASKKDSMNLRLVCEEMAPLVKALDSPVSFIEYEMLNYSYYDMLYKANEDQIRYLDSAIVHCRKLIETYHSLQNPPDYQGHAVSYFFAFLADNLLHTPNPDLDETKDILEEGKTIALEGDFSFFSQYHKAYAQYYFEIKEYNSAISEAQKALELINNAGGDEYAEFYVAIYKILSNIYEAKDEYRQAFQYKKQQVEYEKKYLMNNNMRPFIISERNMMWKRKNSKYGS